MLENLIFLISGVVIFTLGYVLCYYLHIKRHKPSVMGVPKRKSVVKFNVPDYKTQIELTDHVKHKIPERPGKIEKE